MSEFERKLQELFPEIYALHVLAKDESLGGGGEIHIWPLVEQLLEMRRSSATGNIYVNYSAGKIVSLAVKKDLLAFSRTKPIDKDKQS